MSDRRVRVVFEAEIAKFKEGMSQLAQSTEEAAKKAEASGKATDKQVVALKTLAPAAAVAGAGIAAGVGLAVKKYAEFDKAMSSVQAATHESTANMNQLREAAIKAGADTAFSAAEAAQGIEELAKAGVSTTSILNGGLNGALSLAAAGNLGVGESAEIAASAMTQFKLSGDKIPHLADLLAAGAGKAQGSVQDLGAALNQSGLVAASTGLTIEESTGALAAFASAGLTGSDAGTSFKTMLQSLNPNSDKAAKLMDELGIKAYDASGEFIGMSEYAGVLRGALQDMSSEQRNATLKTLFGSDAVRAANVLYEQGAEGINKWEEAVNDAGYAAETAAIMQDNLAGDIEKLGGAFDTVFIQSGGAANDALRFLTQGAEGFVDAIGRIPAPVLGVGTIMAGVAGGALLLGGGLVTMVPRVMDTVSAFKDLSAASPKAAKGIGAVGKAAGVAVIAIGALEIASRLAGSGLDKIGSEAEFSGALRKAAEDADAAREQLKELSAVAGSGGANISSFGMALKTMGNNDFMKTLDFVGSGFGIWDTSASLAADSTQKVGSALATLVRSGDFEGMSAGFRLAALEGESVGISAEETAARLPGFTDAMREVAEAAGATATDQELLNWALTGTPPVAMAAAAATEETASALEDVGLSADGAVESMDKFLESLFATGMATMSSKDAAFQWADSLRDTKDEIEEILKTQGKLGPVLEKGKKDFNDSTDSGKAALELFHGKLREGMEVAETYAKDTSKSQEDVQKQLTSTYEAGVKTAEGFGIGTKAAEALAREAMGIPDDVSVETWISDQAKNGAEATKQAIEAIPGYTSVAVAVSEDGTAGEVQGKVDAITGKMEYVFVTEDGTTVTVQQKIENVNGVERTVYVGDDGTVYTTQGKINNVKDGAATVNVTDGGTVGTVQQKIKNIRGHSVTVTVGYKDPGFKGAGSSSTFATGGPVFGAGTGTSDSIPAMLSNGEHVWTAEEVRKLGGHGAVERLRSMAKLGSLPAFKNGGAVGAAEKKVTSLKRAYEKIDGKKDNRPRKLAAKWEYEDAKKELAAIKAGDKKAEAAAKKTADARKKAAEDEKARQGRLSDSRRELGTDLRRGEITDAFTSGSGLGQIDKLYDASRNQDYSKGKRQGLARDAKALEKSLTILTKKSEGLKVALESATKQADELRSVRDSVAGDLRGEFSLSGMLGDARRDLGAAPVTAKSIGQRANKMARNIEIFAGRLNRLRKMGYGETIVQEVAGLGTTDGTIVAGVLMNATKGEKSSIVKAYDRLDTASGKAGQYVTESMYKGGLDAADGLVKGLEAKTKTVEDAFYKLGKSGEKAFRKSLDMHSPSRTLAIAGGDAVDGSVLGVDRNRHKLETAMFGLGKAGENAFSMQPAFSIPPSAEVARYAAQPVGGASVVIDYNQLAQAMANVQVQANVKIGNKDIAQANTAGRKEMRLPA